MGSASHITHTAMPAGLESLSMDMEAALEASVADADARAAHVNAPLSAALRQNPRLVPDYVVLLEIGKTRSDLRNALLHGDGLAEVRSMCAPTVEQPHGAKIFVRPQQYSLVMNAIEGMDLQPRHIIVSSEFESAVTGVIEGARRVSIKRRRIIGKTKPLFCEDPVAYVHVKRTFIHLEMPSSLPSLPCTD
jgi:hypothetical protein